MQGGRQFAAIGRQKIFGGRVTAFAKNTDITNMHNAIRPKLTAAQLK